MPRVPAANSTRLESDRASEPDSPRVADAGPDPPHEPSRIYSRFPRSPFATPPPGFTGGPQPTSPADEAPTCQLLAEREPADRVGSGGGSRPGSRGRRRGGPPQQRRAKAQHARTHARARETRSVVAAHRLRPVALPGFPVLPPVKRKNVQKIDMHEITLDFREFLLSSIANVRSTTR